MTDFDWYTTGIWHHGIRITTFIRCCEASGDGICGVTTIYMNNGEVKCG